MELKNRVEELDTVLVWGVTVTLAYLLTPYVQYFAVPSINLNYQIITMWAFLMSLPIYKSYQEVEQERDWFKLNPVWAVFVGFGIISNFSAQRRFTGQLLEYSYYHKWMLIPAALFAYTAYKTSGVSRKVYGVAAVLNGFLGGYLFVDPGIQSMVLPIAALTQGVPMFLDWCHQRK